MEGVGAEAEMSGWRFFLETLKCNGDCLYGYLYVLFLVLTHSEFSPPPSQNDLYTRLPGVCSILPLLVLCEFFLHFYLASYNHPSIHHSASDHRSSLEVFCVTSAWKIHRECASQWRSLESQNRAGVLVIGDPKWSLGS